MKYIIIRIYLIICLAFLASCVYKKTINTTIDNKNVTLKNKSLFLYIGKSDNPFLSDYHYGINQLDNGNKWRNKGWILPGEILFIEKVGIYKYDTRGESIEACGSYKCIKTGELKKFIYTYWQPKESYVERAPWDGDDVKKIRHYSEL